MLVCAVSNGPLLDAKHSDLIAAADAFQAVLVVLSFVVEARRSAQVYNVYNADIGASILGTKASDLVCEEGHLEEMGGAFRAGRIIIPAVEDEPVVGHRADGLGGFEVVVLEPVGQRRPFAAETSDVYREGFRLSSVDRKDTRL